MLYLKLFNIGVLKGGLKPYLIGRLGRGSLKPCRFFRQSLSKAVLAQEAVQGGQPLKKMVKVGFFLIKIKLWILKSKQQNPPRK